VATQPHTAGPRAHPRARPRLRAALLRALALLGGSLLALLAAEWTVRLALPQFDPSAQLRLAPVAGLRLGPANTVQRLRKNTGDYDVWVRFGPRGFREARDVATARPGDLLVVGDSFAFGWGVEQGERFSDLLELRLGRRVFNAALPGYGLAGYAAVLRHLAELGSQTPQLVLELHAETDLSECAEAAPPPNARGPRTSEQSHELQALKWNLAGHSALYALATSAVHRTPWLRGVAVRNGLLIPNLAGVNPASASPCPPSAIAAQVAALAAGHAATVLLVPSRGLWVPELAAAEDRAHRALVSALEARGLRLVDPRAAFEASGEPLAHHFAHDGHWNARGHRVAAELLARALQR
jgi:hypothetical protein